MKHSCLYLQQRSVTHTSDSVQSDLSNLIPKSIFLFSVWSPGWFLSPLWIHTSSHLICSSHAAKATRQQCSSSSSSFSPAQLYWSQLDHVCFSKRVWDGSLKQHGWNTSSCADSLIKREKEMNVFIQILCHVVKGYKSKMSVTQWF